jgi:hypothetical protein
MISKSTIAAMVLITTGLASPSFAQVSQGYYDSYAGPYAYPYEQPVPYGWRRARHSFSYMAEVPPYGYRGWPPGSPASIEHNIHTPPNH